MRIRTMLNRKMKLIWEEQGPWLVSAPPAFPQQWEEEMGEPGEMGMFPLEPDLLPSMCHERTSALIVFRTLEQ